MPESIEEASFPSHGINLVQEFEQQPQGTTPLGTNVRAYEALTQRNRGGSRPGIVPYINSQVGGLSSVIQHLNLIVDPTTDALLIDDPVDGIPDPSTNNLSIRNPPPARLVRNGGSGQQPNRNKKKGPPVITSISPNTGPIAGGTNVTVTGRDLGDMSATVAFGAIPATLVSNNGTTLVVTSPNAIGSLPNQDIRVTTPKGTSAIVAADVFYYFWPMQFQFSSNGGATFPQVTPINMVGPGVFSFGGSLTIGANTQTLNFTFNTATGAIDVLWTGLGPDNEQTQGFYSGATFTNVVPPNFARLIYTP
jgi:hypothetical protein